MALAAGAGALTHPEVLAWRRGSDYSDCIALSFSTGGVLSQVPE